MSPLMKRVRWLALPVATMMSLTACSPSPGCIASVHASPGVKDWFAAKKPLPVDVKAYLKAIGDEQAAIDESCSQFGFIL